MKTLKNDWEFNVLNIYNFNKFGNLNYYFNFIKKNHQKIKGDIVEAGVFQGRSLIATALFLKELGSKKKVYGYDTFLGFPFAKDHKFDSNLQWKIMLKKKMISKYHYDEIKKNIKYLSLIKNLRKSQINFKNSSLSNDFSFNSLNLIKKKIKLLKLKNIKLIPGDFKDTIKKNKLPKKIFCSLIDSDLYESYRDSLPYIYDKLERKGYIYLDEFYSLKFPGPRIFCKIFEKRKLIKIQKHKLIKYDFPRYYIKKN
jgi:hypothetical protein